MYERIRVDISVRSSTKEFIELIEKLNKGKTSKSLIVRSKYNSNIVFIETDQIGVPLKYKKKKKDKNDGDKLDGKNGQISIVMAK